MQIKNAVIKILKGHPVLILIYVAAIVVVCGGYMLAHGAPDTPAAEDLKVTVGIVDKDNSELSRAFCEYTKQTQKLQVLDEDTNSLQNLLATNQIDLLMIIPKGYGNDFVAAAQNAVSTSNSGNHTPSTGSTTVAIPKIKSVIGLDAQDVQLAKYSLDRWWNLTAAQAALDSTATQDVLIDRTNEALAQKGHTQEIHVSESTQESNLLGDYLKFSIYFIFCVLVSLVGQILISLNQPLIAKRMNVSSLTFSTYVRQLFTSCLAIVAVVVAFIVVIGSVAAMQLGQELTISSLVLACVSLVVFSLVPLATNFLVAQFTTNEEILYAVGNIGGFVLCTLGGIWIPVEMMSEPMANLSCFLPSFWVNQALSASFSSSPFSADNLMSLASSLGIILLFAAILMVGAQAVAHTRRKTA